jgi:hypothetical protein
VVPIVAINYARQALIDPEKAGDAVNVALFAAVTAAVFVVVTAVHRLRP